MWHVHKYTYSAYFNTGLFQMETLDWYLQLCMTSAYALDKWSASKMKEVQIQVRLKYASFGFPLQTVDPAWSKVNILNIFSA